MFLIFTEKKNLPNFGHGYGKQEASLLSLTMCLTKSARAERSCRPLRLDRVQPKEPARVPQCRLQHQPLVGDPQ